MSKKFRPGHLEWHLQCSYGTIRDLGNRASPSSHMNTSKILRRKEWRGESQPGSYEEALRLKKLTNKQKKTDIHVCREGVLYGHY